MKTDLSDLNRIKLFNIVDMGLTFSAMIRLYKKESKQNIRKKIIKTINKISSIDFQDQFESFHEKFCDWGVQNVILAEKVKNNRIIKKGGPSSYGQIAKTLDVVLKVVVYYCNWPNPQKSVQLSGWLHAAIDNKMMRMLRKEYSKDFPVWPKSVEAVDKDIYKKLQQLVKTFIREKHNDEILPVTFDDLYWHILNRQRELNPSKSKNTVHKTKRLETASKKQKSHTRGGPNKRVYFEWWFDEDLNMVNIETEKNHQHQFRLKEIIKILQQILTEFGSDYFPLANNVQKLGNEAEIRGLGTIILYQTSGGITLAQAASYLGPILEDIRILEWNGKHKGIKWRLINTNIDKESVVNKLKYST